MSKLRPSPTSPQEAPASAHLPQSETHDLIIELRSLTRGVGSFQYEFDRLQELTGKLAADVVDAQSNQ